MLMNKKEIIKYMKTKIPDYSLRENTQKHLFQYSLYVFPFMNSGRNHIFIEHLARTLEEIEKYVPGYSRERIEKIARIGKSEASQIFQEIGEVLVLYNLLALDGTDKNSVELEPSARKGGKNPEYRLKINGTWYAIEVKTPDLSKFEDIRKNGLQVTSRFSDEEVNILKEHRSIVFSKDLKIQDYLKSAEEKFTDYKTNETYNADKTILVIVWDDFINEAVSTLSNPSSGLLTQNSFYSESHFSNVDGVIVLRHLIHLRRLFYFGEAFFYRDIEEEKKNAFNLGDCYDIIPGVFLKNPYGNFNVDLPFVKLDYLDVSNIEYYLDANHVSEYLPTDLVDWSISLGVSGLNFCSDELKEKIISLILEDKNANLEHTNTKMTADFHAVNLRNVLKSCNNDEERAFATVKKIKSTVENIPISQTRELWTPMIESKKHSMLVKEEYNQLKINSAFKDCSCNSGEKYFNCCHKKTMYFKYTNYYTP